MDRSKGNESINKGYVPKPQQEERGYTPKTGQVNNGYQPATGSNTGRGTAPEPAENEEV